MSNPTTPVTTSSANMGAMARGSDDITVEAVLVLGPAGAPPEATMRMTDPVVMPVRIETAGDAEPAEPVPRAGRSPRRRFRQGN